MPYKDPSVAAAKAIERSKKHRAKKHIERFGPSAGRMNGRHGNHARGDRNGRWNAGRLLTSHGYIAVRVSLDHPHGWGGGKNFRYAYEHILIAEDRLQRPLAENEIVHHDNEDKTDNRWPDNLKVVTIPDHMREHALRRGRDELGRFPPADLRVRQFPATGTTGDRKTLLTGGTEA